MSHILTTVTWVLMSKEAVTPILLTNPAEASTTKSAAGRYSECASTRDQVHHHREVNPGMGLRNAHDSYLSNSVCSVAGTMLSALYATVSLYPHKELMT